MALLLEWARDKIAAFRAYPHICPIPIAILHKTQPNLGLTAEPDPSQMSTRFFTNDNSNTLLRKFEGTRVYFA